MSCNGCRVLRKGCSENCVLRPCLQWIDGAEAQGHATVFVAKFFGRAGLMSFISAVPDNQRPALFQSLLFEAAGRTVNPVNGAVGLLWAGRWDVCQEAVDTVLHGGSLRPIQDLQAGPTAHPAEFDEASEVCMDIYKLPNPVDAGNRPKQQQQQQRMAATMIKRRRSSDGQPSSGNEVFPLGSRLNLGLTPDFPLNKSSGHLPTGKRRSGSPSMNSEESVTTICFESGGRQATVAEPKLLDLFR